MTPDPEALRRFAHDQRRHASGGAGRHLGDGSKLLHGAARHAGVHGRPRPWGGPDRVSLELHRHEHGPGGTGNAVRVVGCEEWTIDDNVLIAASFGHYDQAEYARQREHGV